MKGSIISLLALGNCATFPVLRIIFNFWVSLNKIIEDLYLEVRKTPYVAREMCQQFHSETLKEMIFYRVGEASTDG